MLLPVASVFKRYDGLPRILMQLGIWEELDLGVTGRLSVFNDDGDEVREGIGLHSSPCWIVEVRDSALGS